MKSYDAAGVWERVQSAPAADPQNLMGLMEALQLELRIFQLLSRKLPPAQAAPARELSRLAQRHFACLQGMHVLLCGTAPQLRPQPIPTDPPELLLRQCCGRILRLRGEYESRRSDPAHGPIFRLLANELAQYNRLALELLAALAKS